MKMSDINLWCKCLHFEVFVNRILVRINRYKYSIHQTPSTNPLQVAFLSQCVDLSVSQQATIKKRLQAKTTNCKNLDYKLRSSCQSLQNSNKI